MGNTKQVWVLGEIVTGSCDMQGLMGDVVQRQVRHNHDNYYEFLASKKGCFFWEKHFLKRKLFLRGLFNLLLQRTEELSSSLKSFFFFF